MIKINLFPIEEIKKKHQIKVTTLWNILVFATIAIIFTGIYYVNLLELNDINSEIAYNKKKLRELKSLRTQLKKFKKNKQILQTKFKIIKELESFKTTPSYILYILSENIPEKLWLRNFKEDGVNISLSGIAIDEPTIVDFINKLKHTGIFSRIELLQVSQIKISDYKFKTFSIEFTINKNKIESLL